MTDSIANVFGTDEMAIEGLMPMAHFLLLYEVAADYAERRTRLRDEHLRLAWEAVNRGELILGGALEDPVDSAVLLFVGEGPEAAIKFAESDPYVRHGLVSNWKVRTWTTVVGATAEHPVRPQAGRL
jgi:uncharacterized protein